jgi:hypothetical protein
MEENPLSNWLLLLHQIIDASADANVKPSPRIAFGKDERLFYGSS